jgi:hypothetical protein
MEPEKAFATEGRDGRATGVWAARLVGPARFQAASGCGLETKPGLRKIGEEGAMSRKGKSPLRFSALHFIAAATKIPP